MTDTRRRQTSGLSRNPFLDPEPEAPQAVRSPRDTPAFRFAQQLAHDMGSGEFDLPPFPDTALRVQECVRDPNSNIAQLAAIVAHEPALAARLMRMANSVMMRRGTVEVTDINTAISRVGMTVVLNATMAFAAREAFRLPPGTVCLAEVNRLREESVTVGALSYVLAQHVHAIAKPDEAMLAGLLSAVGKFYIYTRTCNHPELFTDRATLDELIAAWHTSVARAIIESWNFPDSIALAVDESEIAERNRLETADISDLLFVAYRIVHGGADLSRSAAALEDLDSLARMRLPRKKLLRILEEDAEAVKSMIDAMNY